MPTPTDSLPAAGRRAARPVELAERGAAWAVGWWEGSWAPQWLAFAAGALGYGLVGFLTAGDVATAQAHATWILDLERATGTDIEPAVQSAFDAAPIAALLSAVYLIAQFVVAPATLLLAHHRAPRTTYRALRDTLLLAWTMGLVVYLVYPVAPPRMAAAAGVSDVVSSSTPIDLSPAHGGIFNQLAAVPSMHVAFAIAVSVAAWVIARGWLGRLFALVWAPLVVLSVIATGNHFTFDALTGALTIAVAAGVVAVVRGRVLPGLRRDGTIPA